ncbi:hypothetical protein C8Q76DRAFT_724329 [Earliella scabrosa]|nr:hypothetical protein C8Q76DRAFT_724329 [Earliella scabrosa]
MSDPDVVAIMRQAHRHSIQTVSSAMFLLYDLLTTFDQEVELIWGSANTLPKFLYFISRYVGILTQLIIATNVFPLFCYEYLMMDTICLLILLLSVELGLMLRVDALYGRSLRVRVLLGVAFVLEMAVSLSLNATSHTSLVRILEPFPLWLSIKGCVSHGGPTTYSLSWIPILAFETLLFVLNTIKCISYGPLDHTPLIYRLLRDGSAYYIIIFAVILFTTIAQFIQEALVTTFSIWLTAIFSYSGCHLLLSIRKAAALRQRMDLTSISAEIPTIGHGSTDDSSLETPQPTHPRPSAQHRIESIELVPQQRVSLHLSSEGSHDSSWAARCTRDWDVVDAEKASTKRHGERAGRSEDETGVRWLERWRP